MDCCPGGWIDFDINLCVLFRLALRRGVTTTRSSQTRPASTATRFAQTTVPHGPPRSSRGTSPIATVTATPKLTDSLLPPATEAEPLPVYEEPAPAVQLTDPAPPPSNAAPPPPDVRPKEPRYRAPTPPPSSPTPMQRSPSPTTFPKQISAETHIYSEIPFCPVDPNPVLPMSPPDIDNDHWEDYPIPDVVSDPVSGTVQTCGLTLEEIYKCSSTNGLYCERCHLHREICSGHLDSALHLNTRAQYMAERFDTLAADTKNQPIPISFPYLRAFIARVYVRCYTCFKLPTACRCPSFKLPPSWTLNWFNPAFNVKVPRPKRPRNRLLLLILNMMLMLQTNSDQIKQARQKILVYMEKYGDPAHSPFPINRHGGIPAGAESSWSPVPPPPWSHTGIPKNLTLQITDFPKSNRFRDIARSGISRFDNLSVAGATGMIANPLPLHTIEETVEISNRQHQEEADREFALALSRRSPTPEDDGSFAAVVRNNPRRSSPDPPPPRQPPAVFTTQGAKIRSPPVQLRIPRNPEPRVRHPSRGPRPPTGMLQIRSPPVPLSDPPPRLPAGRPIPLMQITFPSPPITQHQREFPNLPRPRFNRPTAPQL